MDNTIITSSGLYFDYAVPSPDQVKIEDIAKALSNTCRFGGHCDFYSVAEHSFHCAFLAYQGGYDMETVFFALMHDAQEAYVGDMPKPLKLMMPEFQVLEDRVEVLINSIFNINTQNKKIIKAIDLQMLKAEKLHLFVNDQETWFGFDSISEVGVEIKCWSPNEAESHFLETFEQITGKLSGSIRGG